jgi:Leucine rich repeat variant
MGTTMAASVDPQYHPEELVAPPPPPAPDPEQLRQKAELALARHPRTPAYVLETLALGDWPLRELVAAHSNTPAEVLEQLARDASASVRRRVAGNRTSSDDLVGRLAGDDDSLVRRAAVGEQANRRDPVRLAVRATLDELDQEDRPAATTRPAPANPVAGMSP